jgi:hypothetical protein
MNRPLHDEVVAPSGDDPRDLKSCHGRSNATDAVLF